MSTLTFYPGRLHGAGMVPSAKSEAHRALLLAALGHTPCRLDGFAPPLCDDTHAMINGITALGAQVRAEGASLHVIPAPPPVHGAPMVQCHVHACAAALRMLIPAFLVRGQAVRFTMEQALFRRPLDAFEPIIAAIGGSMTRTPAPDGGFAMVEICGHMHAGCYTIDGTQSSQFASGLLVALPHATDVQGRPAASTLRLTQPIVSRPYLDMTLQLMKQFGIDFTQQQEGVFALSPAQFPSPACVAVAGDWSQAAVLLCAAAMGSDVTVANLSAQSSLQGDSAVTDVLAAMQTADGLRASHIDCSNIPDLAPILALTCTQAHGVSTLTGVSRLRIKECDRLAATQELLTRLGARVQVSEDGDTLTVHGPAQLKGGFAAEARGDHRIVMLLATAALIADAPITVHGTECISKSWPGFVATWQQLGGMVQ